MALSDNQQAVFTLISMILVAIGAVVIPAGMPPYFGLVIMLSGAIGMAIKEWLGSSTPIPIPIPIPVPSTPNLDWDSFLALNGTLSTSAFGIVVATSINPTTKKEWYAIVDNTGHIVLTMIAPAA